MIPKWNITLVGLLWLVSVISLSYIPQHEDFPMIALGYLTSFASYLYLIRSQSIEPTIFIIGLVVLARLLIIPAFPNLSDDIYRFIWDGRLWHGGVHPFLHLPSELILNLQIDNQSLFNDLNSPEYYSIYPPIAQLIFWIGTIWNTSTYQIESIIMKSIHVLFEFGTLGVLWKLLKMYKLKTSRWILYALNPLIIIEVVNNVHHEGIMLFFILMTILLLKQNRIQWAAISFAAAVATKLLPLMFLPILFFRLKGKDKWVFTGIFSLALCVFFAPILWQSNVLTNIFQSAGLYIQSFEFNASLYYVLRAWGQLIYGYNTIHFAGPILKVLTVLGILIYSYKASSSTAKGQLPKYMTWIFGIFLLLSSTVHPWYIVLLIGLVPLSGMKWPIFWSLLIPLTYINYSYGVYYENIWVVAIEYLLLFAFIVYEIKWKSEAPKFQSKKISNSGF